MLLVLMSTTYICDQSKLELVIRNNIYGNYSIINKLSEIKPGAFININWNKKKLMLPYSLRKDYLSFTDKKWDWRYKYNEDGFINKEKPALYELLPSGEIKKHLCQLKETTSNS